MTAHRPQDAGATRRATIKDVAQASGVSIGTISRVINGHANVAADTRARVLDAVTLLDYAPDSAAQSLRMRETRVVGCLIPLASHPVFADLVAAADQVFRQAGYAMIVGSTTDRVSREADLLGVFSGRRVDGLIATLARDNDPVTAARLRALGCPVVLVERTLDGDFDSVMTDQGAGCYAATAHLLALGHRRIALVSSSAQSRPGRVRDQHFRLAFEHHGLCPDDNLIRGIPSPADFGDAEGAAMLNVPDPPTAVIAGVHELVGLMRAVRNRGLEIPRDLSIIAIGDSALAELADPAITVIRWDTAEVGRMAARLALDRIDAGPAIPSRHVLLPTQLLLRRSCAPPPAR